MCCLATTIVLMGPRIGILVWWLINPTRFDLAFSTFIWPFLGFLFVPWTTLMYLAVWSPARGIYGFDWVWLALAFLVDLGSHAGGGYSNRDRIPGYARY
jgi:hypothetical protein